MFNGGFSESENEKKREWNETTREAKQIVGNSSRWTNEKWKSWKDRRFLGMGAREMCVDDRRKTVRLSIEVEGMLGGEG